VGIFNVAGKPLPFKKQLKKLDTADYMAINKGLVGGKLKTYVIDDSQYLMAFEMFDKAQETGYGKFTVCALNFKALLDTIIKDTPPDCIVYLLHHIDKDENGRIKAKTSGKMLDNQLTVEGLFSIVLLARTEGGRHWFDTQSDGMTPCKSPMEMFADMQIDNDLKMVDTTIREYWELNKIKGDSK